VITLDNALNVFDGCCPQTAVDAGSVGFDQIDRAPEELRTDFN
jgi:hypothetical protein